MSNRPAVLVQPAGDTEILVRGGDALNAWRRDHTVDVPGARFSPAYKWGQWDGTKSPGRWCRHVGGGMWEMRASRGILHRLQASFTVQGTLPYEGWDAQEWAAVERIISPHGLNGRTLRDYQSDGIRSGLRKQWGRLALATNAGKGAVIALLGKCLWETKQARTLVLADEVAVFEALCGELDNWGGMPYARIESGVGDPDTIPHTPVAVAMVPTLAGRMKTTKKSTDEDERRAEAWRTWVEGFDALLLDEADKASSDTWKRILQAGKRSRWRLGFSGTFPTDAHGRLVMDELMGPVLDRVQNIELVERGISARPEVELRSYDAAPTLVANPVPAPEWWEMTAPDKRRSVFERAIMCNQDRHRVIRDLIQPETPTCIIVNRIEHGEELEAFIPGSVFVSGQDSKGDRDAVLTEFEEGRIQVLIVTRILDRGSNRLGHTTDLIFASGEGSNRQTLQRIGRGLRRGDGKEFLRLVDIVDRGHKYLATAARKRVELYNREGFDVRVYAEKGLLK